MKELVYSTSKTINSKPIQVMDRNVEYTSNGKRYTIKSHIVTIRDGKTTFMLNEDILTGNNRPGYKYAKETRQQDINRRDTIKALKKINQLFLN
jgi:hypothetical protein